MPTIPWDVPWAKEKQSLEHTFQYVSTLSYVPEQVK